MHGLCRLDWVSSSPGVAVLLALAVTGEFLAHSLQLRDVPGGSFAGLVEVAGRNRDLVGHLAFSEKFANPELASRTLEKYPLLDVFRVRNSDSGTAVREPRV